MEKELDNRRPHRRNKYLKILSKGVPQKIDFIFGPANMGVLPLLSCS
jgi:hypothetical protein